MILSIYLFFFLFLCCCLPVSLVNYIIPFPGLNILVTHSELKADLCSFLHSCFLLIFPAETTNSRATGICLDMKVGNSDRSQVFFGCSCAVIESNWHFLIYLFFFFTFNRNRSMLCFVISLLSRLLLKSNYNVKYDKMLRYPTKLWFYSNIMGD